MGLAPEEEEAREKEREERHNAECFLRRFTPTEYARFQYLINRYGRGNVCLLPDGRFRFYGPLQPARNPGEMAGLRRVKEWNPNTGESRLWFETIDYVGQVRQARPETGIGKVHYTFGPNGNYTGKW